MDDIDRASEREEQLKAQALAHREPEGPKATGYCLACGEELPPNQCDGCQSGWPTRDGVHMVIGGYPGELQSCTADRYPLRWCDAQCRDDWERDNDRG